MVKRAISLAVLAICFFSFGVLPTLGLHLPKGMNDTCLVPPLAKGMKGTRPVPPLAKGMKGTRPVPPPAKGMKGTGPVP